MCKTTIKIEVKSVYFDSLPSCRLTNVNLEAIHKIIKQNIAKNKPKK